jgi:hypothetical protein
MAGQAIVDNATGRRSRYKGDINRALWAGRIDFVKLDVIADRLKPAAAGPYRTVNLGIEKSAVVSFGLQYCPPPSLFHADSQTPASRVMVVRPRSELISRRVPVRDDGSGD